MEVTADRYAVRAPGTFAGPEWTDPDTIVATNHNLCDFSYDGENRRTDVPMTLFGDGQEWNPASGLTAHGMRRVPGKFGDRSGAAPWLYFFSVPSSIGRSIPILGVCT